MKGKAGKISPGCLDLLEVQPEPPYKQPIQLLGLSTHGPLEDIADKLGRVPPSLFSLFDRQSRSNGSESCK